MPRVAAIVRCADLVRYVYSTIVSIDRQTLADREIVLVTDESTPGAARPWLSAVARRHGAQLIEAASLLPGAVRNAGIRATQAPLLVCVNAGDSLSAGFFANAADRLDSERMTDIVSSPVHLLGVAEPSRTVQQEKPDLVTLLGNPDAVHSASMFRRARWSAVEGFDETLPALEDYDFWLRTLSGECSCAWIDEPCLVRQLRKDSLWYRDRDEEKYIAAMTAIVAKHDGLFQDHAADVLFSRERTLVEIGQRYRELIAIRDRGVEELGRLESRAVELRSLIPAGERDSREDFRRTTPVDREWGYSRGTPVDRHYIETFLQSHASDVAGVVLEIQEPDYTRRFGGDRVTRSDVVDLDPGNPRATILTDLRSAGNIPSDRYDCIIVTQTLHVLDDVGAAIGECHRILRPGGVLLATFPCASRLCLEYGPNSDFWRVTEAGARAWFEPHFGPGAIDVQSFGNVLVNAAFLYGLGSHELSEQEFAAQDPYFPLIVGVRARKAAGSNGPARPIARTATDTASVLLYHRVCDVAHDVHQLAISPDAFREQMSHVRRHCNPIPLDDLIAHAQHGTLPPRAVAVTFDDGYRDNLTIARPILDELEIPATFFVTTDRIEEVQEFWWDVLARALPADTSMRPPELHIDFPHGREVLRTGSPDERLAAHWKVYHAIVGLSADVRDAIVDSVRRWSGVSSNADADSARMAAGMLRELAAGGRHAIGAHSTRHEMLPRQTPGVQQRDVRSSRQTLEQVLERPITSFAYPYGAHSAETIEAVRSAAYAIAVTCDELPVTADCDPLRVPRYMVGHARATEFAGWLDSLFRPR